MLINMVLPGAVEVVPPDENTLLLLHGEDLTDGSIYEHAITNSGVTVTDVQSKFGGKSLYFNGASKLQIPADTMFDFGTGDWTFEAWVYPLTNAKDNLFICGTVSGALFIGRTSDNSKMGVGRASVAWDVQTASTLTKNTWNHFACVKASGKIYLFVNGVLAYSVNNTQSYGMAGGAINIGCMFDDYYYMGYMDEVRLSNVARWTENFTPPTEPYNPNGTIKPSAPPATGDFAFTYSGNYTDNRVNGVGTVRLNTSGTLTVTGKAVTVSVYILAGGGGGTMYSTPTAASGGGGGNQTVEVELAPGTYEIVIGTGGAGTYFRPAGGGNGGDTIAFGVTSTGGKGGVFNSSGGIGGSGGTPNGGNGSTGRAAGGTPNGGASTGDSAAANNGGDGYVELTFI